MKNTMDETRFWSLLDGLDENKRGEDLKARLAKLTPGEIYDFEGRFADAYNHLDTQELQDELCEFSDGWLSDDAYEYYRNAIVGKGREKYEQIRKDPELIWVLLGRGDSIFGEMVGYAAMLAYEEKTGEDLPKERPVEPTMAGRSTAGKKPGVGGKGGL